MASIEDKSSHEVTMKVVTDQPAVHDGGMDDDDRALESADDHDDTKDETAQFRSRKGKSSFKIFPVKPDDVFKAEFLKRLKDVESVNCGIFMPIANRDGTPTEYIGLRLMFNEISKRDAALDIYLPEVNDNTDKSGLRRQVWSYPFRGVDNCEDKRLMLYVPRLPLSTTVADIKILFPTADEIEFPVDSSGKNLSYAMIKFKTVEETNTAYDKENGYSIGDITLSVQKIGRGNKRRNQRQRQQKGKRESPQAQKVANISEQPKPDTDHQSKGGKKSKQWSPRVQESSATPVSSSGGDQNMSAMSMMAMQQQMELQMLQIKQQIQMDMQRQMANMMSREGMMGGGNFGPGSSNYTGGPGSSNYTGGPSSTNFTGGQGNYPGAMRSVGDFSMGMNGESGGPSKSKKKRANRGQSPVGADNFDAFDPTAVALSDRPFNTTS